MTALTSRHLLFALLAGLAAVPFAPAQTEPQEAKPQPRMPYTPPAQQPADKMDPQTHEAFEKFFGRPMDEVQDPPLELPFDVLLMAYQKNPTPELAEKVIRRVAKMPERPPISDEARAHFNRGVDLFKQAKSADEMKAVNLELAEACHLAPWWPEARFNFAVALEAMNEPQWAIANFKLYLLLNPPAQDALDALARISALETRLKKTSETKNSADEQAGHPFITTLGPRREADAPAAKPDPVRQARDLAVPHRPMPFDFRMSTAPWIREMRGMVKDAGDLWRALAPLQPPPGARGAYGLLGDDVLMGKPDGYGLQQLGKLARRYLVLERLYVEQPAGWERLGVQSGVFTSVDQMNDVTLGWAFFDLRPQFEAEMKKLVAQR